MKTQNLLLSKEIATNPFQKIIGFAAWLFFFTIFLGCTIFSSTTVMGSDLLKLKDGNRAITLSGGKVTTFTPPTVSVRGMVDLAGSHTCLPVALGINPASVAGGWFVVPTTGGLVAVINSMGAIIGYYDLPGDHVMEIIEFKPNGDFSVQTTGGLVSFFTAAGVFLGTIDLPGDHGMKQILSPDSTQVAVVNQSNEIFILGKDPVTGQPIQIGMTINCPGSPAYFEWGLLINLNNQVFDFDGNMLADFPGAFAFYECGLLLNQNFQVFNLANPTATPLDLPGSPAYKPIEVIAGNVLLINQNFQIFNVNPAGPGGGPKQNGQGLNLPGAPVKHKDPKQLLIPGGANAGNFLAVNQNGQIWIINPGNQANGPAIVGGPINLPNSPLYVERNGIPGVYVVASTGGHVDIIDARGPGGPVILASFDYPGEHTGKPVMDKDADGNHFVHISTTSGLYTIDKSSFMVQHVNPNQLGGQLVCCMAPVMPGEALGGDDVPVMCDVSMSGELEMSSALISVKNPDSGEILSFFESQVPPFQVNFHVPEYAMPGTVFTVEYEIFDFGFTPVGQGVGVLSVVSPVKVEAIENLEALPGEMVNPVFWVTNSGNEPLQLQAMINNEMGWACMPSMMPLFLPPGDTSVLTFESVVPPFMMPGSNTFHLEAINLMNPMLGGSDYMTVKVLGNSQQISLMSGWSGISTWLNPVPPDVETLFAPIEPDLVIMMNMMDIYWPAQNINTIGSWNREKGYQIKLFNDVTLTITGTISDNQTITLNPGWHIIPVLSSENVSAMGVLDAPGVVLAKEIAGNKVFWPGQSIYTLETLETGKAYMVKVAAEVTLTFSAKGANIGCKIPVGNGIENNPWPTTKPTPGSHVIAISPTFANMFSSNDLIGVFDAEGNNHGLARLGNNHEALVVYADDPTTSEVDGMIAGEETFFKVFCSGTGETVSVAPVFNVEFPDYSGTFAIDGISAIDLTTGFKPADWKHTISIFPNPVQDKLNIIIPDEKNEDFQITILNMNGAIVFENETTNVAEMIIDLSSNVDGCYLLKISNGTENLIKKIILKK